MRIIEPTRITQGEEIEWTRSFADFPASLYTVAYRFRGPGYGFDVAATADSDDHHAELESAQSLAAKIGRWQWQAWATEIADSDHVQMITSGFTQILQGYASGTTAAIELRTPAKITLDALNAAIADKATADQLEYEISTPTGSRRIKRMMMSDLLSARKTYAAIVANENAREKIRNGGNLGTKIDVRFSER